MVLLILAAISLGIAGFLVSQALTLHGRQREALLRQAATYGRRQTAPLEFANEAFRDRALVPLKTALARFALRLTPKATAEGVSMKLMVAGLGRRVSPTGFLAAKAAAAASGLVGGFILGTAAGGGAKGLLLGLVFGALGFVFPDIALTVRSRGRKDRLRAQLPDALDLLAVSVEAGMGFDGAIAKLTEYMEGPLIEEFALTLGEMRIGEGRQEALKRMAERASTPEVGTFVRAIVQADQLGISLGKILRVQAAESRLRRQTAAEEKAMKAPIKMLFPTAIFIFPAMFLVILGPAMMSLKEMF